MGVSVSAPKLDLPSMMNFKQQGIDGNVKGVEFLMKKNKIDVIVGKGKILGTGKIEVSGNDGKTQTVETKNIVIATGSDIARSRASRSTKSASCLRPARCRSTRCRANS